MKKLEEKIAQFKKKLYLCTEFIYVRLDNNLFDMENKQFSYELLVIDNSGKSEITTEKSLLQGLAYSEKLWNDPIVDKNEIKDASLSIVLKVTRVDMEGSLNDYDMQSAFFINIRGCQFDKLEEFRKKILIHLRKLGFSNTRILKDDISTSLSVEIYPYINKIENLLRSFLVKFFIQKVGLNWWDVTAPNLLKDKIKGRKNNEKNFSPYSDTDVSLSDFDDLGELIYKQSSGFNSQEKILEKIMNTTSVDELQTLKEELQGNYTKYFKETFKDKQFDTKWKQLFDIRNLVAHNNLLTINDKEVAIQLSSDVEKIIKDAEKMIKDLTFSTEEKEAIRNATIEQIEAEQSAQNNAEEDAPRPHVIGKIDLPQDTSRFNRKIATEDDLLEEVKFFSRFSDRVACKGVVDQLWRKGFDRTTAYSLMNIMTSKGIFEQYKFTDPDGIEINAIRLAQK